MNSHLETLKNVLKSILNKHAPECSPLLDMLLDLMEQEKHEEHTNEDLEFNPIPSEADENQLTIFDKKGRTREDDFSNYDLNKLQIDYNSDKKKIYYTYQNKQISLKKENFDRALYFFYIWDCSKENLTDIWNSHEKALLVRILSRLGFLKIVKKLQAFKKEKPEDFNFSSFKDFIAELKRRYEKEYGPTEMFDVDEE